MPAVALENCQRRLEDGADTRMERSRVVELHYITPISNLPSIAERGILSNRRAHEVGHASIADEAVQGIREQKLVPGGRPLHEYANVYFDARNPMMYRRLNHRLEVAVVRVDSAALEIPGTVVTDGNAASGATSFLPSPGGLAQLDEERVYAQFWTDPDSWIYWEKKRQRCAEVLVPDQIPSDLIRGCYVVEESLLTVCRATAPSLDVAVERRVFFS